MDSNITYSCDMKTHKRTQTGVKPYECEVCDKAFWDKSILARHIMIHTGEKPYHCDVCDKAFSQKSSLTDHGRIHSNEKPYACDTCEKEFSRQSALNKHQRIHSGAKPYECDVCKKTFSDGSNLIHHKKIHTGEKPYKCDICKKSYSHCSLLSRHNKTPAHIKMTESRNIDPYVGCVETIKVEDIKVKEEMDVVDIVEDPEGDASAVIIKAEDIKCEIKVEENVKYPSSIKQHNN